MIRSAFTSYNLLTNTSSQFGRLTIDHSTEENRRRFNYWYSQTLRSHWLVSISILFLLKPSTWPLNCSNFFCPIVGIVPRSSLEASRSWLINHLKTKGQIWWAERVWTGPHAPQNSKRHVACACFKTSNSKCSGQVGSVSRSQWVRMTVTCPSVHACFLQSRMNWQY